MCSLILKAHLSHHKLVSDLESRHLVSVQLHLLPYNNSRVQSTNSLISNRSYRLLPKMLVPSNYSSVCIRFLAMVLLWETIAHKGHEWWKLELYFAPAFHKFLYFWLQFFIPWWSSLFIQNKCQFPLGVRMGLGQWIWSFYFLWNFVSSFLT